MTTTGHRGSADTPPAHDGRSKGWLVFAGLVVAVACVVLVAALWRVWGSGARLELSAAILPKAATAPAVPAPRMPEKAVEVTVVQRHAEVVPGTDGTVLLSIGDITAGQTLVSVTLKDGTPLLPNTSLPKGRTTRFRVGQAEYKLTAKELKNLLVGEDFGTFVVAPAGGAGLAEPQKIERLIAYVAGLEGAVFVRNGREHPPAEAADHMRTKWKAAGGRTGTARQFVEAAATQSSLTGEPYLVRFKDGGERPAAELLNAELNRLEAADEAARDEETTTSIPPSPPKGANAGDRQEGQR
jgi:hypothetical protein